MKRWDGLVDGYLGECRTRGLAVGTVSRLETELTLWGRWLKARRPRPRLEAVESEMIVAYLRARSSFHAKATLSGTASALRGMGEYLLRQGVWSSNPLRWIKGPKLDPRCRLPRRIGKPQMDRLWQAASATRGVYHRHLWLGVLAMLYGTGLRRGELVRLDVDDWDPVALLLRVDGRKTGRERMVAVPAVAAQFLETYLPQRQNLLFRVDRPSESTLFVNGQGEPLKGQAVTHAIQRIAQRAGLEGVTLHQFRHTCASDLLESGARLPEVREILGHRALETTMRYLHIEEPARREAMVRHPLNEWLAQAVAA